MPVNRIFLTLCFSHAVRPLSVAPVEPSSPSTVAAPPGNEHVTDRSQLMREDTRTEANSPPAPCVIVGCPGRGRHLPIVPGQSADALGASSELRLGRRESLALEAMKS